MKAYVLPHEPNKVLIRALHSVYIRDDFSFFTHRLSIVLRSQKVMTASCSRELLLLINRIYLTNIYKYIDLDAASLFVESLRNKQFGWELNIESYQVCDFFRPLVGMSVHEMDYMEVENYVTRELSTFLANIYNNDTAVFNEAFLGVFEMFQQLIPTHQVKVCRFELTSNLAPLVLYTDRVTKSQLPRAKPRGLQNVATLRQQD